RQAARASVARRVKSLGPRLGYETHEVESLGEIERAQLAAVALGDEEVPALDCAAEDRARVALWAVSVAPFRGRACAAARAYLARFRVRGLAANDGASCARHLRWSLQLCSARSDASHWSFQTIAECGRVLG